MSTQEFIDNLYISRQNEVEIASQALIESFLKDEKEMIDHMEELCKQRNEAMECYNKALWGRRPSDMTPEERENAINLKNTFDGLKRTIRLVEIKHKNLRANLNHELFLAKRRVYLKYEPLIRTVKGEKEKAKEEDDEDDQCCKP